MRPLLSFFVSILFFSVASIGANVKGVDIWFAFNWENPKTSPHLVIFIVGGWRVQSEKWTTWFEATETPPARDKVFSVPVGHEIATAFYEHMIQYLNYNGFNMGVFGKEGRFSDMWIDGTLPGEPPGPNKGAFGFYLDGHYNFPFDRSGALIDAIRTYWEHPNRDPNYDRDGGPGYKVTVRRTNSGMYSIPQTGDTEWEENWLSYKPPHYAEAHKYPPARGPWQWRELPPPEAGRRARQRRDVCPNIAADPRRFVDGEEKDLSNLKGVILRCPEMDKPPG